MTSSANQAWNILVLMGIAYSEIKDDEKANELFKSALSQGSDKFPIFRAIGRYYYSKKHFKDAKEYLEKANISIKMIQLLRELLNKIESKNRIGKQLVAA